MRILDSHMQTGSKTELSAKVLQAKNFMMIEVQPRMFIHFKSVIK